MFIHVLNFPILVSDRLLANSLQQNAFQNLGAHCCKNEFRLSYILIVYKFVYYSGYQKRNHYCIVNVVYIYEICHARYMHVKFQHIV